MQKSAYPEYFSVTAVTKVKAWNEDVLVISFKKAPPRIKVGAHIYPYNSDENNNSLRL